MGDVYKGADISKGIASAVGDETDAEKKKRLEQEAAAAKAGKSKSSETLLSFIGDAAKETGSDLFNGASEALGLVKKKK